MSRMYGLPISMSMIEMTVTIVPITIDITFCTQELRGKIFL